MTILPLVRSPLFGLALLFAVVCPQVVSATGDSEALQEACQQIGAKLNSVTAQACLQRGVTLSGGHSVEGKPLLVREYPPLPDKKPQARVLVLGGIHGDEYASVSIVFKWMEVLEAHHSGLFHWLVAPLVNPDGLLRENSVRLNANGVDLNRNFFTKEWAKESSHYWIKRTGKDPRRFPGTAPASEPETRWVAELIDQFRPNAIISVHAPYNLLDFDGPTPPPNRLGSLKLSYLGTFPGSLGRFAGVEKDISVITIELSQAGTLPSVTEQERIWNDMILWLRLRIHDVRPGTGGQVAQGRRTKTSHAD